MHNYIRFEQVKFLIQVINSSKNIDHLLCEKNVNQFLFISNIYKIYFFLNLNE